MLDEIIGAGLGGRSIGAFGVELVFVLVLRIPLK
jgi:hypothetical protein